MSEQSIGLKQWIADSALNHLQLEAETTFGEAHWGEETRCTYDDGYQTQFIHLCRTCSREKGSPVAVCFGCSMSCHLDHEIVELWKKRAMRCDCATHVFCGFQQQQQLAPDNQLNRYEPAQNFLKGQFCLCSADGEQNEAAQGAMLMCDVCTEWFHETCVGIREEDQVEGKLICNQCVAVRAPFLQQFPVPVCSATTTTTTSTPEDSSGANISQEGVTQSVYHGARILPLNYRSLLCKCASCVKMYSQLSVEFLLIDDEFDDDDYDDDDADADVDPRALPAAELQSFLQRRRQRTGDVAAVSLDHHMDAALSTVPHSKAVNLARGYSQFRDTLADFIKTRTADKRVFTVEDAEQFKQEMLKRTKKN